MSITNSATIIGRITKDLEVKEIAGTKFLNLTLAVNRSYKNKEGKYDADFIPVSAVNKTAEIIAQYYTKGDILAVNGELHFDNYTDKEGKPATRAYVNVREIDFNIPKRSKSGNGSAASAAPAAPAQEEPVQETIGEVIDEDDDLPF